MKITVCYDVQFDIEVEEAATNFLRGCSNGNHLKEGYLWSLLAHFTDGKIGKALDFADGVEITAVLDEDCDILWENC